MESAFEQERREAMESVAAGLAERPDDPVTRLACTYLLQHLRSAPATEHCFAMAA